MLLSLLSKLRAEALSIAPTPTLFRRVAGIFLSLLCLLPPTQSLRAQSVEGWGSQVVLSTRLYSVVAISTSEAHNLALLRDGTVRGWGFNEFGQATVPVGLDRVVAVSAGRGHSLALKNDGTVTAWGDNQFRQAEVPNGLRNVVRIAAGGNHSLAVRADGTVVGWGSMLYGQTTAPAGLNGVVAIATGGYHSLALKSDGTVVAWGDNSREQIAVPAGLSGVVAIAVGRWHNLAIKADGTIVAWGYNGSGQVRVPAGLSGVVAIAAGEDHSLALKSDGTVISWGSNSNGQIPVPQGLNNAVAVAAGSRHSLVLKGDGTVVAWGGNDGAQAMSPGELRDIVAIAAGDQHNLALKKDGTLLGWGSNHFGQATVPNGLRNVVAIAAGLYHSLALENDGTVVAWGSDYAGQSRVPEALGKVVAIAAGAYHSLALQSDGTVVAWGGSPANNVPSGLNGVVAIAAGQHHSLALRGDGTVLGWGDNVTGNTSIPDGLNSVVAIASTYNHSLALRSDGTVVAWGRDWYGSTVVPVGLADVVAIAAGNHSVALKREGTVVSWGWADSWVTQVPADASGAVAIAAGYSHSLALRRDSGFYPTSTNIAFHAGATQSAPYLVSYSVTSPQPGAISGTVTVTESFGGSCSGPAPTGSCYLTAGRRGVQMVQARYSGDAFYGASAGTRWQTIRAGTTTSVGAIAPEPSMAGQPYTVPFTVTSNSGTPSGTVTVYDGSVSATCAVSAGTCSLTSTTAGAKTITVVYGGDGSFAGSSATSAHIVNGAASGPGVPVLASPGNHAAGVPLHSPLTWSAAAGATSYDVYFGGSNPPPLAGNTAALSYTPPALASATTYYWKIAPRNSFGIAASATWSFTTAAGAGGGLRFVALTPCRLVDTRPAYAGPLTGALGPPMLAAATTRTIPIPSSPTCAVPPTAKAYVLNLTLDTYENRTGPVDFVTLWPAGDPRPEFYTARTSTGGYIANAAIVRAGTGGAINVYASSAVNLILDINGYFTDDVATPGLLYYPMTPCRAVDTRGPVYSSLPPPYGNQRMQDRENRSLRLPGSPGCQIPVAAAYSMQLTLAPGEFTNGGPVAFVTAYPTGMGQPNISTMNALLGYAVANSAIVPASGSGSIDVYAYNATNLILDVNGYFAPDDGTGRGLLYYPATQCRVMNTIDGTLSGPYGGPLSAATDRTVPVPGGRCAGLPSSARAWALNASVIPNGVGMPYLSLWPTGTAWPNISQLNAFQGQTIANSGIVPASASGSIDVRVAATTHVILEVSGYFAR